MARWRVAAAVWVVIFMAGACRCWGAEGAAAPTFDELHRDKKIVFEEFSKTITVNEDWSCLTEYRKKVRIQKDGGREMGEIPVAYMRGMQEIVELSAHTITPNGRRHRYTAAQDMQAYPHDPEYSDMMVRVITMPEVNVGSVIELRTLIRTMTPLIAGTFWETQNLTNDVPTKLVRFKVSFPKKLNIRYKGFGVSHPPVVTDDGTTVTYAWEMRDIYENRQAEEYAPPPTADDYRESVEFSSIGEWSDIARWYYGLVEKNLAMTPEIEAAARKAAEGKLTVKDTTRALLEYVQDNFRYVSMSFGSYRLEPHPTPEVFANKYGDCKDLSLLLVAMLKVVGIDAHLALFREEGEINDPRQDLPVPSLFDHVLVLVDDGNGGEFYVDPQLTGYDIGEYPWSFQRAYTFIISPEGGRFGRLPVFSGKRTEHRMNSTNTIGGDGSEVCEIESEWDLDTSIRVRETFKSYSEDEKKKLYDAIDRDGAVVLERRVENLDKRYGPLRSYMKTRDPDAYLVSDGLIVLDVGGYARDVDLTKDRREKPIFFGISSTSEDITTYRIPDGFRVLSMPADVDKDIGIFRLKRTYERRRGAVVVRETAWSRRGEVPVEEYAKLRAFYERLPRDTFQRIVLKRTTPAREYVRNAFDNLARACWGTAVVNAAEIAWMRARGACPWFA